MIVVRGGSRGLVGLLIGEMTVLWELKLEMWLGEERVCWIGDRYVRRGSANRSLRMECLRPGGLLLLRSHRLGLRSLPAIHHQFVFRYSEYEETDFIEFLQPLIQSLDHLPLLGKLHLRLLFSRLDSDVLRILF